MRLPFAQFCAYCVFALVALFGALGCNAQSIGSGSSHIHATLVPESTTPAAGSSTTVAILMEPQPGWHGYWHTPGDSGLTQKLTWTLPNGVTADDPSYPVPETLLIDGLMNHVYGAPYALLVRLELAPGLPKASELPLRLKLNYLACTATSCVPETAVVTSSMTVGDGAADAGSAERFAAWRRALPQPLNAQGSFTVQQGRFRLIVPWAADRRLDNPHLFVDASGVVAFAAPQRFSRTGDQLVVETSAAGEPVNAAAAIKVVIGSKAGEGVTFTAVRSAATAGTAASVPSASHGSLATISLTLVAFAGAVLGGLILNIMPCVFPILSLKALSLARSAEESGAAASAKTEALAYTAGVIVVCMVLGALILALRAAGSQVGWAFQLQKPAVIYVLILLTSAIGFNLAGLFELSSVTVGSDLASKSGSTGAFWTGALAAFVATPCTGPFMAAALGAALVLPWVAALFIFFGLGLGLALPFLAIGFVPAVRRRLPKPGAWMGTLRRILAVPMFFTVLGLTWVIGHQSGSDAVVISLAAMLILTLGLWATGLRQHAFEDRAWLPAALALMLALPGIELLPALATPTQTAEAHSEQFSDSRLAALRAAGKPVFLYLTADWCLTCKVNEMTAIHRPQTQEAFAKAGVVTMIGNWTNGDAAIGAFLEQHGRSGVPMYLWYAPGKEAQVLPQILTSPLLVNLTHQ
ncbi:MAG: thioredoxin family protein [Proteobacteria bacterium]|nr:thioredoxin family protein [Pseudomonadota bacterium]